MPVLWALASNQEGEGRLKQDHSLNFQQPYNDADHDEPLSCDSCGWVIKPDEVHAVTKDGDVLCEHCLDQGRSPKELQ